MAGPFRVSRPINGGGNRRAMASSLSTNQVIGIVMIVLGLLILLGWFGGILLTLVAVALIVLGILILIGKMAGSTLTGVVCLILGILLLAPGIPVISDILGALERVALIVIGVLLLVFGILKVANKA